MSSNFTVVQSAEHFQSTLSADLGRVSLINFWAAWAEPCKQMNEVVVELAKKYPSVLVLQVEAEALPDIAESFDVDSVPSFVILRGHTLLGRVTGADAPKLTEALAAHVSRAPQAQAQTDRAPAPPPADEKEVLNEKAVVVEEKEKEETAEELEQRLRGLMGQSKVVLFMKGSPDAPRCGFSRKTVALLREQDVKFTHFDVLSDEGVRQGMKVLNNWPTFPQIIVNGELVGGLDVLEESVESGEFKEIVEA